ncbi:hypothetical protein HD806DRAFT_544830 [Xylariaceae sp. AK1471]|nr:hypothetical protein HD806DRAFT_544830 [Xylariaceae sp. AK1471]
MPDNESTENHQSHFPAAMAHKRRLGPSSQENSRGKRAKYNTNACEACKKCKLKCDRNEGEKDCQRCLNTSRPCIYAHPPLHLQTPTHVAATDYSLLETRRSGSPLSPAGATVSVPIPGDDIVSLKQQVTSLSIELKELSDKVSLLVSSSSPVNQPNRHDYLVTASSRQYEPRQPLFVGHTQSAFSLHAAKTSLSRMGISPDVAVATGGLPSLAPSPHELSPEPGVDTNLTPNLLSTAEDPLLTIPLNEVCRLIAVFREEIETLYPFVDSDELTAVAGAKMRELSKHLETLDSNSRIKPDLSEDRDISLLKVAVATSIVVEAQGRNPLSSRLIDSTDKKAAQVTRSSDVDLRDLQCIYYFQIDEDLLAWRTIGNAARMALEMGLHRRRSLMDNYKSADLQARATRVFWCVYALDRRWSFGTGLSFALNDRDIDPELPEPGDDYSHLRCLIGYGRLCSKVWEVLPPYGSPTTTIPLDQNWLDSFPAHLQFNHPRLGLTPRNQPRAQRRLCVLLYLRGNHLRTLVHRHHVLSTSLVHADLHSARLVVDIAKDSIRVLVDLAETSDIYVRQQAACNYFLLSALAVILLAVCNAPKNFSDSCHESFLSAVELVRNFSHGSLASRRLWNSIRGLVPAMRALGLKVRAEDSITKQPEGSVNSVQQVSSQHHDSPQLSSTEKDIPQLTPFSVSPGGVTSVLNTFQMGEDLMGLFEAFGQADAEAMTMFDDTLLGLDPNYMSMTFPMEVSRRFQSLI